jgi:hypothetical protein
VIVLLGVGTILDAGDWQDGDAEHAGRAFRLP